jgi:hypothetical protein
VRVAVAAMLLVFLGSSAFALGEDGRRAPASLSTPASGPASDSAAPASGSAANAASAATSVSPNALVAALPGAPPISEELRTVEPVSPEPSATVVVPGSEFLVKDSLAPIHALLTPPAAFIKLKTPPRTHSFFDARNTLGFATLGASLTADALSTQKGLAYPGFVEMNPIARPFVQSRMGAAAYNAGSFCLMAGLMYWAHKKEHHKLERILPLAVGSWEGLLSMRNYHVIANRAR